MRAFRRGAYDEADRLFERFAARAVGDARVEDADYLRAVAHGRMGDRAGAAKLARAYLDAFPAGLRRREAEQLTSP
jgi:outer membrane protein assembly factor BamD (BamD/ComL family)